MCLESLSPVVWSDFHRFVCLFLFYINVFCLQLQTEFVQAGDTQFVTTINDADSINHVVVFLTGVQPFPDHMAGSGLYNVK